MKYLTLVILILFSSTNSLAITGNEFKHMCDSNSEWCAGYVNGLLEGIQMGWSIAILESNNKNAAQYDFCIPDIATQGQLVDVVKKYLDDHPEELHEDHRVLIGWSARDTFPCAQQ